MLGAMINPERWIVTLHNGLSVGQVQNSSKIRFEKAGPGEPIRPGWTGDQSHRGVPQQESSCPDGHVCHHRKQLEWGLDYVQKSIEDQFFPERPPARH